MSDVEGQKIGRYAILGLVGSGAAGTVYRALDPTIGRVIALKVIPARPEADTAHDERSPLLSAAKLFQREAQAAGALLHPNIVTLYDAGLDGSSYYLAMEFVEGETLGAALNRDGRFPVIRALDVMAVVCEAIDFAHERGIVHRDLKPANLMLLPDGTVKVADFGIARLASFSAASATASIIAGTPSYMSPEQIRGESVDRRSDVFALGVVLYELLTGKKPFRAESVVATMNMILTQAAKPPRELNPEISPELSNALMRALEKDPARRFASARELADELRAERRRIADRETMIATADAAAERSQPAAGAVAEPQVFVLEDVVEETTPPPRRLLAWALGVVAALVLIGGLLMGRSREPTPERVAASAPTAEGNRGKGAASDTSATKATPVSAAAAGPGTSAEPRVSLGVMVFKPLEVDSGDEWMREALRDGLNARLSGLSGVKVFSKEYIEFLISRKGLTELEAASQLGIKKMLSGSYRAIGGMVQVEMHVVDVASGVLDSSFTLAGRESEFSNLQNQVALDLVSRLDLPVTEAERRKLEKPQENADDRIRMLLESEGNTEPAPPSRDGAPARGSRQDPLSSAPASPPPSREARPEPLSSAPAHDRLALAGFARTFVAAVRAGFDALAPEAALAATTGEDSPEERSAILSLIERYRHAIEANEIGTLADLYSSFSPAQRTAQQNYFTAVRNLKVSLADVDVAIVGDEAIASYTRTDDFVDARTGRPMHISVRLTKNLKREGGTWKISN